MELLTLKNGKILQVETVRFCTLSTGVKIGVFRNLDSRAKFSGKYLVVVKRGREFLHQLNFLTLVTSIQTYLDYICRYA